MNIVPFSFESQEIRTLVINGEPLFVAKDVAIALGYDNTQQAVRAHCKKSKSLMDMGCCPTAPLTNQQHTLDPQTKLIPESDVYRLTMKSTLPSAERFQDWVVEEVLPSIRKTGGYALPAASELQSVVDATKCYLALANIYGLSGNQALLSTNRTVYREFGIDVLAKLDLKLIAEKKEMLLTPTEIGREIDLSPIGVNNRLIEIGFQTRHFNHKNAPYYEPTDAGKPYCEVLDVDKRHGGGTPVKQVKWFRNVIDMLGTRH